MVVSHKENADDQTQGLRFIKLLQQINEKIKHLYLERSSLQELLERFQSYQQIEDIEANELKKKLLASERRCQLLEQQLRHIQMHLLQGHGSSQLGRTSQSTVNSLDRDIAVNKEIYSKHTTSSVDKAHIQPRVLHGVGEGCKGMGNFLVRHSWMKLQDIPFVPGKSTSASHSVAANLQGTFAALQKHSRLCSSNSHPCCRPFQNGCLKPHTVVAKYRMAPCSPKLKASSKGIKDLLVELQEEYSTLLFAYEDGCRNLAQTKRTDLNSGMIKEVEELAHRIKMKKQQLDHLQAIQMLVHDSYRKHKTRTLSGTISCWHTRLAADAARTDAKKTRSRSVPRPHSTTQRKQFLQHLKELQSDLG